MCGEMHVSELFTTLQHETEILIVFPFSYMSHISIETHVAFLCITFLEWQWYSKTTLLYGWSNWKYNI